MPSLPFSYIIGLEIHAELSTQTKMFCRCLNDPFNAEANQHICPVCLGLPGTLPVPNKEAVQKTVLVGKALGSSINKLSKWDRKHYFYPDLPKGYQISQYDLPFCVGGELSLLDSQGKVESTVRFERVHLEEDAGKLLHGSKPGFSRVDLNRAGVPLIEMVTKPDLRTPEQARRFMQELRQVVRALGVSEADMEKGQMRCDVNISLEFDFEGQKINTPITEIKNVNSTRAVERSLIAEGQRLYNEWFSGGPIRQRRNKITAGWDENSGTVRVNRAKEAANEYRYFPEPDIPSVKVYEITELNPDGMVLPELPNQRRLRYLKEGMVMADIEVLIGNEHLSVVADKYLAIGIVGKEVAKWIVNGQAADYLSAAQVQWLTILTGQGNVSFSSLKSHIQAMGNCKTESDLLEYLKLNNLLQEHDESVVQSAVAEVLQANLQGVQEYKDGNQRVLGFLVGQVMKKTGGKAQPAKVQQAVQEALNN